MSISVSLQQEAFITGLTNLGKTLWLDNGFREMFLVMAVKPYIKLNISNLLVYIYRHSYSQSQEAALQMR